MSNTMAAVNADAVILGNNPGTCGHIYPTTRDGRCHGCGEPMPMPPVATAPLNPRHLSETTEHYTPQHVIDAAHKTLVEIDLDPATSEHANKERTRAKRIFTAETNGFLLPWEGRVFLNPPGGSCDQYGVSVRRLPTKVLPGGPEVKVWSCGPEACGHEHVGVRSSQKAWWQKLVFEWEVGRTASAIFVGFSVEILQTTQVDPVGQLPLEFPICVPSRRLAYSRFKEGDGYVVGASPPHASVLIFLPPLGDEENSIVRMGATQHSNTHEAIERFVEAFSSIGHVSVPWRWR